MSSTNYRHFVDKTMALARSLTIKSEASVIQINQYIQALGYSVSDDATTWKYYMNLAGEYHFLDPKITITSLDTQKPISFDKETLKIHLATKNNYKPGSRYYLDLVKQYPEQELLIRGIVSPIDKQTAINAEDFELLDYDPTYVESNETNLIPELVRRIKEFNVRWNNPNYVPVDDLYITANLAMLYYQLPGWIFNIRLANCKTRYAHSFHIREYLSSHGKLDTYFDYLSKAQMLFLYRNILYIENNAGKQATFEWLIDRILSARGIGLAEYNLHHNLDNMPDEIRPTPEFTRKALNTYHTSAYSDKHTFKELLEKERPVAVHNQDVEKQTLAEDTPKIQNARRDSFPTKVLESALIDWSESGVLIRSLFLMNHWAYWSSIKRYQAVLQVSHPRSGNRLKIPMDHAFILFLYTYNRSMGVTLDTIPNIRAQAIRRQPTPSREDLTQIIDRKYVSQEIIDYAATQSFTTQNLVSIGQFVQLADALLNQFNKDREVYSLQQNQMARGQVQALMDHLYMDTMTEFEDAGTPYNQWMATYGYNFSDLTKLEYQNISNKLLETATGIKLTSTQNARSVQKAMVALMTQLSSYAIQYIREFNVGPILFWAWPATRFGEVEAQGQGYQRTEMAVSDVLNVKAKGTERVQLNLDNYFQLKFGASGVARIQYHVKPLLTQKERRVDYIRTQIARSKMELLPEQA